MGIHRAAESLHLPKPGRRLANEVRGGYVKGVIAFSAKDTAMPLPLAHRLITALFVLGFFGTLAAGQPQRPPADPLAEARARQAVADQKATIEVMGVIASWRNARPGPIR